MSQWRPDPRFDTCSAAHHDTFAVIGVDGRRYPTWHPPDSVEDGAPCTFGHEHGRNPAGSSLRVAVDELYGGVLFGYANEQLDAFNTARKIADGRRHEDHVGHKIEWENDVAMFESTTAGGANARPLQITCDFLMKIHQGTHSPDAFTNNLHELLYAVQCRDRADGTIGTKLISYTVVQFGVPGTFSEGSPGAGFREIEAGPAVPSGSPTGGGLRSIPTFDRATSAILVEPGTTSQYSLGLYEDWISANYLQRSGSRSALAYFDPHFAVFMPSRFYWPAGAATAGIARHDADAAAALGRSIDLCYMAVDGRRAGGGECDDVRRLGRVAFDDPRSPFNGAQREFYLNQTRIVNAAGPTTWYTDPFGGRASPRPFPGGIRQFIAAVDNRKRSERGTIAMGGRVYAFESRALGKDRPYGGRGVHAPN
ncbi:MAG: hypothetical protein AB7U83_13670 [Vicinamibacterales bacterium]